MLPGMKKSRRRPDVAIIGAGNLGRALALFLKRANYRISEVVSRDKRTSRSKAGTLARQVGARVLYLERDTISAPLVWLCVPDREITPSANALAKLKWKGRFVFHSSGALGSDALQPLRERGASVASVHPLMTFVPDSRPSLGDVPFALEGDREAVSLARQIVLDLGGQSFPIAKQDKPLYHAWGTFVSPLLTILLEIGERVANAANIPPKLARKRASNILHQTVENYVQHGAALGFSGPLVRGDAATVRRHLQVLRAVPEARAVYRALAIAALQTLPVHNKTELRRILR